MSILQAQIYIQDVEVKLSLPVRVIEHLKYILADDEELQFTGLGYIYEVVVRHFNLDGYGPLEEVLDNELFYELPKILIELLKEEGYHCKIFVLEILNVIYTFIYANKNPSYIFKLHDLAESICAGSQIYLQYIQDPNLEIRLRAISLLSKCVQSKSDLYLIYDAYEKELNPKLKNVLREILENN